MTESPIDRFDFDLKVRSAAYRVLQVITLQRQAKVAVWASAALSVVAAARPDLLSPNLLVLKGILNVGAINALLNDVAQKEEVDDEQIAVRMEELLLPVLKDDQYDRLLTGQRDLLQVLGRQLGLLEKSIEQGQNNETRLAELIKYSLIITGDLYTIRQLLSSSHALIQQVLNVDRAVNIDLPIVVVAMTEQQAQGLIYGEIRQGVNSKILTGHKRYARLDNNQWIEHYRETPDEWIPFLSPAMGQTSIWEVVVDLIAGINTHKDGPDQILVQPKSLSKEFFDPVRNRDAFRELIDKGGILIIDPISLNHPKVLEPVITSGVLGNPNVSIIMVNPLDLSSSRIHLDLRTSVDEKLSMFSVRFSDGLDFRCEYSGGDMIYLRRWLFQQISDFKQDSRKPAMSSGKGVSRILCKSPVCS